MTPYWNGTQWVTNSYSLFNNGTVLGMGNVTSPRAQLEIGGTDGLLVTGTQNSGTIRALGAGMRFHWYPRKGALRAGKAETTYWDDDGSSYPKLALYSVALGYQPRATATASNAIGAYNQATADYALSLGSYSQATGTHAVAIGTQVVASGIYSMAIGAGANTNGREGAMVIGDNSYFQTAYASCGNQLTMRFTGNEGVPCSTGDGCGGAAYRLWTSYPDCIAGAYMRGGQSGWVSYSSVARKENFRKLDGEWLLGKIRDFSISEWSYKGTDPTVKYIGPMAEEFWEAFHLNGDDTLGINTISIDGVNMAGVQALEKRTAEQRADIAALEETIAALKERNGALERRIAALEATIRRATPSPEP